MTKTETNHTEQEMTWHLWKPRSTALYERLSHDDKLQGESSSITNQKKFLQDFAQRNGLPNIRHFTDDGVSGTTFDRLVFKNMIAEAQAGKVACVVVKNMGRFGRDYLKVGFYTDVLFQDKGVRFIAFNNGINSDKQYENDFTPFLNIMNEWYARDCSRKIKAIFKSRMQDGKRMSPSVPYGRSIIMTENQNTNTATTAQNNMPPAMVKKIGKTTYYVTLHFSETNRETMSDKTKRLIGRK